MRARLVTVIVTSAAVGGMGLAGPAASGAPPASDVGSAAVDRPTWVLEPPGRHDSARYNGMATYDSAAEQVIMFGSELPNHLTHAWNGRRWREIDSTIQPPPRGEAAFAYDPVRDEVVMFGGHVPKGATMGDTWVLKDGEWEQRYPETNPGPDFEIAMAFDPHLQQLVLAGHDRGSTTWTWDGTNWIQLHPEHSPMTCDDDLVYSPVHDGLVMFDGHETWLWDGTDWSLLELKKSPPFRGGGELTTWRGHAVLVGGIARSDVLSDIWMLRRDCWRLVRTQGERPERFLAAAATHEARDEIVVFGGFDNPYGPATNSTFTLRF